MNDPLAYGNNRARRRPHEIADQLTRKIVDGGYAKGAKLPTERELALEFNTNRNVVREALKRLEALGLVRILQGSGIYVEDLQFQSSIALFDALLRRDDGGVNTVFLRDVIEFRANLVRMIVRAAALRRTPEEVERMKRLVRRRHRHLDDTEQRNAISYELFRVITEASRNQVYAVLLNTIEKIYVRLRDIVDHPLLGVERAQHVIEQVVDAIEQGDSVLAELIVWRYAQAVIEVLGVAPETGNLPGDSGPEALFL